MLCRVGFWGFAIYGLDTCCVIGWRGVRPVAQGVPAVKDVPTHSV
jgi:hypothetical protein